MLRANATREMRPPKSILRSVLPNVYFRAIVRVRALYSIPEMPVIYLNLQESIVDSPPKHSLYTLLVFDWDGTLIDSEDKIIAVIHAAVDDLGLPRLSDAGIRDIIGLSFRASFQSLFPGREEDVLFRFIERYRHHFEIRAASKPFPGVPETLRTLRENGFLMAVATGKSRAGLEKDLSATGLGEIFHLTRCADEAPSKPHPGMLQEIMMELMIEPENALMIGDSAHDLEMARNAGVDSVAVTYGVLRDKKRLLQYGPRACLDAFSDLAGWLTPRMAKSFVPDFQRTSPRTDKA